MKIYAWDVLRTAYCVQIEDDDDDDFELAKGHECDRETKSHEPVILLLFVFIIII